LRAPRSLRLLSHSLAHTSTHNRKSNRGARRDRGVLSYGQEILRALRSLRLLSPARWERKDRRGRKERRDFFHSDVGNSVHSARPSGPGTACGVSGFSRTVIARLRDQNIDARPRRPHSSFVYARHSACSAFSAVAFPQGAGNAKTAKTAKNCFGPRSSPR